MATTPNRNRSLRLQKATGQPGKLYYPLHIVELPVPSPGPHELLIRIDAAALNHRDLLIRRNLLPDISLSSPLLSDGCGTVLAAHPTCGRRAQGLVGGRVLITPSRGWASDPAGPEDISRFAIVGGNSSLEGQGTSQDLVLLHEDEVEPAPAHLSLAETAALPLVGLTAWRALGAKSGGNAGPGRNVLITGIGGGVAIAALQFAVARGCRVFVTSGDEAKIERARKLGAAGGVNYRNADWDRRLLEQLPADRPLIDLIVDGAGADIVHRAITFLKAGGVITQYGMTAPFGGAAQRATPVGPTMEWLMTAVLKNMDIRGSTMGSRAEFKEMVEFVAEKGIIPVVSRVVHGLDNVDAIDGLFEEMAAAKQFGKLVIEFEHGQHQHQQDDQVVEGQSAGA